MGLLNYAIRSILLYGKYNMGVILLLFVGAFAIGLVQAYFESTVSSIQEVSRIKLMQGDVIIDAGDGGEILLADQERIESFLKNEFEFTQVLRVLEFKGFLDSHKGLVIVRVSAPDLVQAKKMRGPKWAWDAVAGKPFQHGELALAQGLASKIGCEFEELHEQLSFEGYVQQARGLKCPTSYLTLTAVNKSGKQAASKFKAMQIQDVFDVYFSKYHVSIGLKDAQQMLNTDAITRYSVKFPSNFTDKQLSQNILRLKESVSKISNSLYVKELVQHRNGNRLKAYLLYSGFMRNLLLYIFGFVIVITVFLAIQKMINDRGRELGVLRAIGFSKRAIFLSLILEIVLMGCLYSSLVVAVKYIVIFCWNQLNWQYFLANSTQLIPLTFSNDWVVFVGVLAFVNLLIIGCMVIIAGLKLREPILENLSISR